MSGFWSAWVIALVVANLGVTLFLFLWGPRVEIPTQADGTTGHVWAHGALREGVHRLPAWWIAVSAAMFVACFAYLALYPGFGAYKGALGWTSSGEEAHDAAQNRERLEAAVLARVHGAAVDRLAGDPGALRVGERLFVNNCAACHGPDGRGNPGAGYPALQAQHSVYTTKQLTDYAAEQRYVDQAGQPTRSRNGQMMTTIAKRLTADDVRDLAAYLQGMR